MSDYGILLHNLVMYPTIRTSSLNDPSRRERANLLEELVRDQQAMDRLVVPGRLDLPVLAVSSGCKLLGCASLPLQTLTFYTVIRGPRTVSFDVGVTFSRRNGFNSRTATP
jgi:hypothetical protein